MVIEIRGKGVIEFFRMSNTPLGADASISSPGTVCKSRWKERLARLDEQMFPFQPWHGHQHCESLPKST